MVLNLSYFSHFTSNISGQQCMGLEAALARKTCTFGLTKKPTCKQFHLQKTIELYCDIWKPFYSKWTEIIVEIQLIWFWLTNVLPVIRLWKRRNNTVNEPYWWFLLFSIRGIHLPIVLLILLSVMYKLKESTLYLKSGGNSLIYFLFTQHSAP